MAWIIVLYCIASAVTIEATHYYFSKTKNGKVDSEIIVFCSIIMALIGGLIIHTYKADRIITFFTIAL